MSEAQIKQSFSRSVDLPTDEEIRAQLARILVAKPFVGSEKSSRLLAYLVKASLCSSKGDVGQYQIAEEVLGLGLDFDPDKNPIVRVGVGRVRRLLNRYFAEIGKTDPVVFSIALGSYRVSFARLGDALSSKCQSALPVLGVVEFAGIDLSLKWSSLPAVLAEELLSALGGTPELRLLGPFSRARLAAEGIESFQLGRRHKVDFILDGSIREIDSRQTLRVRLFEGGSGLLLWSQKYEWGGTHTWDLAALEIDLMRKVASEIGVDYGPLNTHLSDLARVKPAHALALHEAASMARSYFQSLDLDRLERSESALRAVIRKYPDEALPYALLALVLTGIAFEFRCARPLPIREISALARSAAALDFSSSWVLNAQAVSAVLEGRDNDLSEIAGRADNPNAPKTLLGAIGLWLVYRKVKREEGLCWIEEACLENPHHPGVLRLGPCLANLDLADWNGVLREIDAYGISWGWCDPLMRATAHAALGDHEKARLEWQRVLAYDANFGNTGLTRCEILWHPDYTALIAEKLRAADIDIAHRSR